MRKGGVVGRKKHETWKFHENQVFQQLHEQRLETKEDTKKKRTDRVFILA